MNNKNSQINRHNQSNQQSNQYQRSNETKPYLNTPRIEVFQDAQTIDLVIKIIKSQLETIDVYRTTRKVEELIKSQQFKRERQKAEESQKEEQISENTTLAKSINQQLIMSKVMQESVYNGSSQIGQNIENVQDLPKHYYEAEQLHKLNMQANYWSKQFLKLKYTHAQTLKLFEQRSREATKASVKVSILEEKLKQLKLQNSKLKKAKIGNQQTGNSSEIKQVGNPKQPGNPNQGNYKPPKYTSESKQGFG